MTHKTANLICLVMIVIASIAFAIAFPGMSEQVPTHWNAAGEADNYSSRWIGVLIGPVGALSMWLLMWLIPIISPKGFRTDEFNNIINIIQVVLVLFMLAIGAMVVLAGHGMQPSVDRFVPIAIGLLFVVLGNYMAKLRKNFFIGIRTPWTLASDEVWAKTHRLAGYLFFAAGVGVIIAALAGAGNMAILYVALPASFIPVVYSFVAYKRIEGFSEE